MVSVTLRSSFSTGYGLGTEAEDRRTQLGSVYCRQERATTQESTCRCCPATTKPDYACTEGQKWVSSTVQKLPNNSWVPHCSNVERWFKRASHMTEKAKQTKQDREGRANHIQRVMAQRWRQDILCSKTGRDNIQRQTHPRNKRTSEGKLRQQNFHKGSWGRQGSQETH